MAHATADGICMAEATLEAGTLGPSSRLTRMATRPVGSRLPMTRSARPEYAAETSVRYLRASGNMPEDTDGTGRIKNSIQHHTNILTKETWKQD